MALEIERRFLVRADGWRAAVLWQAELCQGYLVADPHGLTLRVRSSRQLAEPSAAAPGVSQSGAAGHELQAGTDADADAMTRAWLTLKAAPEAPIACRSDQAAAEAADEARSGAAAGSAPASPALVRLEFEYPIPIADAEALLRLAPHRLRKRRHGLRWPGGDWVVDAFADANAPLLVAEVELADADAPLQLPDWCGQELTGRHELSNAALARRPLREWPEPQRRALLQGLEPA